MATATFEYRVRDRAGKLSTGKLDAESIVTPGIFVDRVVAIANPAHESELVEAGASYP